MMQIYDMIDWLLGATLRAGPSCRASYRTFVLNAAVLYLVYLLLLV